MMNMLKHTAKNNPFGLAKKSLNLVMEPSPPDEPKTSTNNPMGQMRRDSTYIIVGSKGDKTTKNAYDLYADLGMDNNLEAIQERIKKQEALDEGPTLKKFVNKIKFQKKVGAILMSSKEKQIGDLKSLCQKACHKLKVTPRSRFLKQIGHKDLNLENECLSPRELNAVISVMLEDQFTSSLNLSGNSLNGSIAHYIDTLLTKNNKITELDLSENNFADDLLPTLTKSISASKQLRNLNLSGNHFTDRYAKQIAEIIEKNTSLESLSLSHNEFREKGGLFIGNALAGNTHLYHLDLSWNHLRGKGAESLSIGLMKNSDLVSLDISWNGFGFEGCVAIGHALRHNTTLEDLDISNNRIHAPALFEFLKGLSNNKGLLTLKIGPNPVPAIATTPFLKCLKDNQHMTLTNLDFSGIVVAEDFQAVVDEIRDIRPEFKVKFDCILPIHKGNRREALRRQNTLRETVFNVDPLKILYYTQKNLRIVDLFYKMDVDGDTRLTRDEVREALKKENFNLSTSAIDTIFDTLDVDGNGEIDLKEFLDGSRRFKRDAIAEREEQERIERTEVEQSVGNIEADPGGLRGRFSSTFRPQDESLEFEEQ